MASADASGELLTPLPFLAERRPVVTAGLGCLAALPLAAGALPLGLLWVGAGEGWREALLRAAAASARSKSDSLA